MCGPRSPFSDEIHRTKYRAEGESFEQAMKRVATGLADNATHFDQFCEVITDMRFMPAGRVQTAIGAAKRVTPYNCYVSGEIKDSFVEGQGSIMQCAHEAAATMRMGGGIGYDFSSLRPRGAMIKGLGSRSSGPLAFMEIFDAVCRCVASSGHRRGAQMGVLRVDHPDIEEFVEAKQNQTRLTGFNISIAVTDEFMEAVSLGRPFNLRFGGQIYKTVDALELWEKIMSSTWDWAEPGVLFIDRINYMNNLYYCEKITATNPCGEQPLPAYGACLLGSFNLVRYLYWPDGAFAPGLGAGFDWNKLKADIPAVVRAMDNVVDTALYPLPMQEAEAKAKRRMGLGVTGLANAAEALGFPYGSADFLAFSRTVLETIRDSSYAASATLAYEKGAFPLYDERYLKGNFIKTLAPDVQGMISMLGIRNSHLTSIAPTGTISLAADNVSSGIEPVFSYGFQRTYRTFEGDRHELVEDYGVKYLGVRGRVSDVISAQEHVAALCVAARHVDSAVSKTCNVAPTMPWSDFKALYLAAWDGGAKGCTTFNSGGKRFGILTVVEPKQEVTMTIDPALVGQTCELDPTTGKRSCE